MTTSNYDSELTVLGLPAAKGRWLLIPLGMGVLLCLGTVYSWSIFRKPLETELNLSATESLLPYTVALVFLCRFYADCRFFYPPGRYSQDDRYRRNYRRFRLYSR